MPVVIFLGSYMGMSDFMFTVDCSGRKLSIEEVFEKGLCDDDILRRHQRSDFSQEWYEVTEGDQIKICWWENLRDEETTFIIPAELPNPPQNPDDMDRTGMYLYDYLDKYCKRAT